MRRTVTLADANDAVFDSAALVTLGSGSIPGTLNCTNGLTLDFGGNITGHSTINTPNNSARPLINNSHIAGGSARADNRRVYRYCRIALRDSKSQERS